MGSKWKRNDSRSSMRETTLESEHRALNGKEMTLGHELRALNGKVDSGP